ncbi:hypothetical protein F5878DRAFT_647467 [Lentinula raphanica]|uniref:Uncharacterized protein n=1 Tax=Lentinula raphanica TaxID=153919 RepID=A0AA38NW03_9AGAR|nr:hypothetical protein F5878DRAFT_647467 [Lentinula raphanica]
MNLQVPQLAIPDSNITFSASNPVISSTSESEPDPVTMSDSINAVPTLDPNASLTSESNPRVAIDIHTGTQSLSLQEGQSRVSTDTAPAKESHLEPDLTTQEPDSEVVAVEAAVGVNRRARGRGRGRGRGGRGGCGSKTAASEDSEGPTDTLPPERAATRRTTKRG